MAKDDSTPGKVVEDKPVYIVSNMDNDRIYSNLYGHIRLVNKDVTTYKGKILKRRITVKGLDGNNFFSHVYETQDQRWFNKGGLPIAKPNNIVKQTENEVADESK